VRVSLPGAGLLAIQQASLSIMPKKPSSASDIGSSALAEGFVRSALCFSTRRRIAALNGYFALAPVGTFPSLAEEVGPDISGPLGQRCLLTLEHMSCIMSPHHNPNMPANPPPTRSAVVRFKAHLNVIQRNHINRLEVEPNDPVQPRQTRCSATGRDQMPVNDFWRLFGVLLPDHTLFRQNGFPSSHLILLDLKGDTAEGGHILSKFDARV
jgi:hypothetical protein